MPETIEHILDAVGTEKPMARQTLHSLMKRAGIKPVDGIRTRPRLYPDGTACRVLAAIGIRKFRKQKGAE